MNIWRDIPEAKRVIGTIIGLNLIVFLAWRMKRLEPFLLKYFTSSPYKRKIKFYLKQQQQLMICLLIANVSSMLLSTFSHYNGIHFFCNMYVLWSFSEPVIRMFGKEQFYGKLIK
jgi:rhomboid-like protein